MAVFAYTADIDGILTSATGVIAEESISGNSEVSVSLSVGLDIDSFIGSPPYDYFYGCLWRARIRVIDSNPSKSDLFGGEPPRERYGRVSYSAGLNYGFTEFIQTQLSVFPNSYCSVIPPAGEPPDSEESFPATQLVNGILQIPQVFFSNGNGFNTAVGYYDRFAVEERSMVTYTRLIDYLVVSFPILDPGLLFVVSEK
jgi:hypothetical protein